VKKPKVRLSKFFYNSTATQVRKIILNFGCKTTGIKGLATSLLAIELITGQKGILTTTKHSNIFLKLGKEILRVVRSRLERRTCFLLAKTLRFYLRLKILMAYL
jgi:ribosomal protein L5